MKKRWMNVLRVAITMAALAFLVLTVDLRKVLGNLGEANLLYLGTAFLLFVFSLGLRAYRWFVLLQGLDPDADYRLLKVGQVLGGAELMYTGLDLPFILGDFQSHTWRLEMVQKE